MFAHFALSVALLTTPLLISRNAPNSSEVHPLAKDTQTDPAALQDALTKLLKAGVIDDMKLWTEYCEPKTSVESFKIRDLMIAAANRFEHVDSFDAAMEVLKTNKVFANPEYWRTVAQRPKVSGDSTSLLIMALSRSFK